MLFGSAPHYSGPQYLTGTLKVFAHRSPNMSWDDCRQETYSEGVGDPFSTIFLAVAVGHDLGYTYGETPVSED